MEVRCDLKHEEWAYHLDHLLSKVLRRAVVVNALVSIDEVNQRRARLVLGCVTVPRQVTHLYATSQLGQLSLPSFWIGK